MPGRRRPAACAGAVKRSAWSMPPAAQLLVAGEPGQDRQARGVGRGPAARAQAVRAQAPDRAGAGAPAPAAGDRVGGEQLVQPAAVAVDDDHVAVAVRAAPAFDGALRGIGYGPRSDSSRVVEADGHPPLAPRRRSCTGCRSAVPRSGPSRSRRGPWRRARCCARSRRVARRPAGGRRAGSSGLSPGRSGSAGAFAERAAAQADGAASTASAAERATAARPARGRPHGPSVPRFRCPLCCETRQARRIPLKATSRTRRSQMATKVVEERAGVARAADARAVRGDAQEGHRARVHRRVPRQPRARASTAASAAATSCSARTTKFDSGTGWPSFYEPIGRGERLDRGATAAS